MPTVSVAEEEGRCRFLLGWPSRLQTSQCSGTSPCDSCLQRSLDCTYSGTDGRTQLFRRQKFEELHSDSELLRDFLGSIRSGDDGQLQGLVTTIRAPSTMKETKIALRWRLDEITTTQDSTKQDGDDLGGPSEVIQQVNRSVLKITQLTDSSAQRSPSKPSSSWSDVVLR